MSKQTKAEDTELSQLYRAGTKPKARSERFGPASHMRNLHGYHATPGSKLEQYLKPEFWSPLARNLRPLDRIEVTEELGAWTATLIVKSVGMDVDLALVSYTEIGGIGAVGAKAESPAGYRITFGGVHSRWSIYRGETLVIDGLPSEKAAEAWLENRTAQINPGAAA
jgi:hypothetical protein